VILLLGFQYISSTHLLDVCEADTSRTRKITGFPHFLGRTCFTWRFRGIFLFTDRCLALDINRSEVKFGYFDHFLMSRYVGGMLRVSRFPSLLRIHNQALNGKAPVLTTVFGNETIVLKLQL
jgi:hypothetical protein